MNNRLHTKPFVAILMGSESDVTTMKHSFQMLQELSIPFEAHILSLHRTPHETLAYVQSAEQRGCAVFIAAAGLAAHLAGGVAAHTIRPVIGVPIAAGSLQGVDALLSTVQMPGGVPVACVAIGSAGAKNAAILAAQILALQDSVLATKLSDLRQQKKEELKAADAGLQKQLCKLHKFSFPTQKPNFCQALPPVRPVTYLLPAMPKIAFHSSCHSFW